jgi:hypothetical protein
MHVGYPCLYMSTINLENIYVRFDKPPVCSFMTNKNSKLITANII